MKLKESKKVGTFYGVGVGPGDPELLTLKAQRVLKGAGCIAVPKSRADGDSLAMSIVEKGVGIEGKEVLELVLPMTRDGEALEGARREAAGEVTARLAKGSDVAYITLGDPLFYSTFSYLVPLVSENLPDARVEVVPGVTSISAAASSAGLIVARGDEKVVIVPSIRDIREIRGLIKGFHTVVLMKVSSAIDEIVDLLAQLGLTERAVFVSKAGWPDEEVVRDVRTLKGRKVDYFSMMIVKGGHRFVKEREP
jgi:precorrin-2/cobalt-factor-2 C20-methyltransferase